MYYIYIVIDNENEIIASYESEYDAKKCVIEETVKTKSYHYIVESEFKQEKP
jgi:hypothetical protein